MSIEIRLSRSDRVYHPGEKLEGEVIICSKGETLQHSGIRLAATGSVQLRLSDKAVGVFESLFLNVRPVPLLSEMMELAGPGLCPPGTTRIPFAMPLRPPSENASTALFETYHGINVNVQYGVAAECDRSLVRGGKLSTGLIEFIIEDTGLTGRAQDTCQKSSPVPFVVSPGGQTVITGNTRLFPDNFKIEGQLDHELQAIAYPISGSVKVERLGRPLKSIELTLARVEWCSLGDGSTQVAKEITDIQLTQIADGPVAEGVEMPIHMVLPRLYTCPSVSTRTWGVNFELTVAVHVDDGQSEATAAVKLPLTLLRTPRTGNIHI